MSVPGSGWGYDKDIAQSLADIAEHLGRIVNHLDTKEERILAAQEMAREAAEAAPNISLFGEVGNVIIETLDNENLNLLTKHKTLRELAIMLKNKTKDLEKGSDHGKIEEIRRGRKIRGDKA